MGLIEDLESQRKGSSQGKIWDWLNTLGKEEREQFVAACLESNTVFASADLLGVVNRAGCDATESTFLRFRKKLRAENLREIP